MNRRFGRFFVGLILAGFGNFIFLCYSAVSPGSGVKFSDFLHDMVNSVLTFTHPVAAFLVLLGVAALVSGFTLMIWGVVSQNPKILRAIPVLLDLARTNLAPGSEGTPLLAQGTPRFNEPATVRVFGLTEPRTK